jgi:hypothetical protein
MMTKLRRGKAFRMINLTGTTLKNQVSTVKRMTMMVRMIRMIRIVRMIRMIKTIMMIRIMMVRNPNIQKKTDSRCPRCLSFKLYH